MFNKIIALTSALILTAAMPSRGKNNSEPIKQTADFHTGFCRFQSENQGHHYHSSRFFSSESGKKQPKWNNPASDEQTLNDWITFEYTEEKIERLIKSFEEGHSPWRFDPMDVVIDYVHNKIQDDSISELINMDNLIIRYDLEDNKYLELRMECADNNYLHSKVSQYRYIENNNLSDWIRTQYTPDMQYTSNIQQEALNFIECCLQETKNISKTKLHLIFNNEGKTFECFLIRPKEDSGLWIIDKYKTA